METTLSPINLLIVIASTRPGRQGKAISDWFCAIAERDPRFTVSVADLKDIALPLLDEPNHPGMQDYQHDHTKAWSTLVGGSDAFVFVTPEYNHGLLASLKNALDYLFVEWANKALGLVSYGGVSGGIRSAGMIKQVAAALHLFPVVNQVILPFSAKHLANGVFVPGEDAALAAMATLDAIAKLDAGLSVVRAS